MIGSVGRPGKVIYTNLESLKLRRRKIRESEGKREGGKKPRISSHFSS
jgi:hypothetical protein